MPTLDWIGKRAVVNHHQQVPTRLLRCDPASSAGNPDTGNLIVQGDNLNALKALLPHYAGKVKCIYIDPPYNTGNEGWIYNDNVNAPEIKAWLGKAVGKEAEDLSRHDKWLCMMYPRLKLLREFLSPEGSIFVSIDENESGHLRLLLDEIFGKNSHVSTLVWQKRTSRENRAAIGSAHDQILIYSGARADEWKQHRNKLPPNSNGFSNPDEDERGLWRSIPFSAQGTRPNQMYDILAPAGNVLLPPRGRCWGATEEVFNRYLAEGRVYFPRGGRGKPRIKQFQGEEEGLVPMSWWEATDCGDNQEAKKELIKLNLEGDLFDTPKPTRLIKRILTIATDPDALVLDSFAGSGTTMHATMQLNREDGGNRRCILVEMKEEIATDITAERIRRVMKQDDAREDEGFRFCTLGEPLFGADGTVNEKVTYRDLAHHVFFTETGRPLPKGTKGPELGTDGDRRIFLLFTGVMGDRSTDGGNLLNRATLRACGGENTDSGPRTIYAEGCRLSDATLQRLDITFKQLPYDVKAS